MSTAADTPLITDDWHISGRVYREQALFEQEMRTVFARSWVFVAHESEIAAGGDYKTAQIGLQPVVVTRSPDDGEIHVMFNRCRHRGSAVCQREFGNANHFRCAYHGWTYSSSGELVGVPFPDGYDESFDKSAMGLVHVPRVENYRGFVFASLDAHAPSLPEYLGPAARYLDFIADLPGGVELSARAHKLSYEGNWKLQVENTIDPYHFSFTHKSWLDIIKDRTGKPSAWVKNLTTNPGWRTVDLANGHSAHEYGPLEDHVNAPKGTGTSNFTGGELLPFNFIIFPTLSFVGAHLRLVVPRSATETRVFLYPLVPKDLGEEELATVLRNHESFYGPSGAGSTDDIEVGFERVMAGLSATATSEDWVLMSRGLDREVVDEEAGVRYGRSSDEVPQRGFYRRWLELMNGDADA
jgi:phenylpropionate dioxygenase-like ring-hydroxylating dioxygenase large terminal subunit